MTRICSGSLREGYECVQFHRNSLQQCPMSITKYYKITNICYRNSLESVYSSNSRLNLLHKRKRLNPILDMSSQSINKGDRYVTQRVLSAKTHRVKQLQNQLADAHYHLQVSFVNFKRAAEEPNL